MPYNQVYFLHIHHIPPQKNLRRDLIEVDEQYK